MIFYMFDFQLATNSQIKIFSSNKLKQNDFQLSTYFICLTFNFLLTLHRQNDKSLGNTSTWHISFYFIETISN